MQVVPPAGQEGWHTPGGPSPQKPLGARSSILGPQHHVFPSKATPEELLALQPLSHCSHTPTVTSPTYSRASHPAHTHLHLHAHEPTSSHTHTQPYTHINTSPSLCRCTHLHTHVTTPGMCRPTPARTPTGALTDGWLGSGRGGLHPRATNTSWATPRPPILGILSSAMEAVLCHTRHSAVFDSMLCLQDLPPGVHLLQWLQLHGTALNQPSCRLMDTSRWL